MRQPSGRSLGERMDDLHRGSWTSHARHGRGRWGWDWVPSVAAAFAACAVITGCGASSSPATGRPAVGAALPAPCATKAPSRVPAPRWSAARAKLAPPNPSAIRLCRYSGLNAHPRLTLVGSRLLDSRSAVQQLVSEFDRLPSLTGAVACPADDGSQILAALTYPAGHEVTITVGLTGCDLVTNGSVHRSAAGIGSPRPFGPQLVAELEHLVPAHSRSGPAPAGGPAGASPPRTVISRRLRAAAPGGLRPGTAVSAAFTGVRVFANRRIGFAITDIPTAGDGTYPVSTANGGRTWRTDGPVLHIPAAQGAIAVGQAGVAGPKIYFAWCGACNNVIDVTPDAGGHWWQAFMPGQVLTVLGAPSAQAGLTAVVEGPTSAADGRGASLWVYRSSDGRRWTYSSSMNAVS